MGAYDGLYPVRAGIRKFKRQDRWTVEYDTGKMVNRICDLPPVMQHRVEEFYSRAAALACARQHPNAVVTHYEDSVPCD